MARKRDCELFFFVCVPVKAGADVRVSVRGSVIDVHVSEAVIGTVIRIAAHKGTLVPSSCVIQNRNGFDLPYAK